jgi:hypothetical protein
MRYMYLFNRKETLPVNKVHLPHQLEGFLPVEEVHVPHQPEGNPSGQRGTSTSSIGRVSFRSKRYMYLINRKETLPVKEVHLPHQPEGNPSGQDSIWGRYLGTAPFLPKNWHPAPLCSGTRYLAKGTNKQSLHQTEKIMKT